MRTSTLQYLYLQKPVTMMVIICIISILPWIGIGSLSIVGEPETTAAATSILESGNWILPRIGTTDIASNPPMSQWLTAIFSYPQGYVSVFTSHLPSALALIALIGFILVFFGKRIVKFQEAFIAPLLLVTCAGIHHVSMTSQSDMLFTAFITIGLFQLYRWEEKLELKGLPVIIPILLGCAILTKGLLGVILPLFIFGVYLLFLNRYSNLIIFKSLLYMGISSMFLPLLWYVSAWKQGGDDFIQAVLASFVPEPGNGPFYSLGSLAGGFAPWTLFFFFSLFGLKIAKPTISFKGILQNAWQRICSMEKVRLFSLIALVCILFLYSIPFGKYGADQIPAYPFIALFLSQYAIYITEYRTKVTRIFAAVIASVVVVFMIAVLLTMGGVIDPVGIISLYTSDLSVISLTKHANDILTTHDPSIVFIVAVVLLALGIVYYQMFKKINIKILYATIALTFAVNLLFDRIIM